MGQTGIQYMLPMEFVVELLTSWWILGRSWTHTLGSSGKVVQGGPQGFLVQGANPWSVLTQGHSNPRAQWTNELFHLRGDLCIGVPSFSIRGDCHMGSNPGLESRCPWSRSLCFHIALWPVQVRIPSSVKQGLRRIRPLQANVQWPYFCSPKCKNVTDNVSAFENSFLITMNKSML